MSENLLPVDPAALRDDDMTKEMLDRSRAAAAAMGWRNVEFRQGVIEDLPLEGSSVDVVISNGVINLCADKRQVFAEVMRVLKPGGRLQFADIANGKEVPAGSAPQYRLVDRLNCWRPAVCRLAAYARAKRFRRCRDRPPG